MKVLNYKLLISSFLILSMQSGFTQDIQGMYKYSELREMQEQYSSTLKKFYYNKLWPTFNSTQKLLLQEVRFYFPLTSEFSVKDPLCYYASARDRSITMSIKSMKFLDDLCLAIAWLANKGYTVETVSDYLSMINNSIVHKFPVSNTPEPLKTLGIPLNAKSDPAVHDLALALFLSAKVFIFCHELGHIYYRHPGNHAVSEYRSRKHEQQADAFALDLLKNIPVIPIGITLWFTLYSHLEWDGQGSTHPLSTTRLKELAANLQQHAYGFAKDPVTKAFIPQEKRKVLHLAKALYKLAESLNDKELKQSIFLGGRYRTLETLKPRKKGELPGMTSKSTGKFTGYFKGEFIRRVQGEYEYLDVSVRLKRQGNLVSGTFNFGFGDALISNGKVDGNKLTFDWSWAGISGAGVLYIDGNNNSMDGTWGYKRGSKTYLSGGGKWSLNRY